jgi:valyl-tRNA synthetase
MIDEKANQAPVVIVGEMRLLLEVQINIEQEKIRLDKEITRLRGEINKSQAKLENEAFASKAPEAVVAQEKARLKEFSELAAKLELQLLRL